MLRRRSNTQNISWFADQYSFGRLDLDPPYQRKSIWTLEYKKFFIDTVLNNYPCPTLFLNVDTSPEGSSLYHVIDGKQRLTTVLEYIRDEFKTSRNSNPDIADRYFSELTDEQKTSFFEYTFTIENISGASPGTLHEAFDRLNRNVAKLTDQELRHAKYSGIFINFVETISGDLIWKEIGISTPANVRRMKDVEFVSEIFLLIMHGIIDGKAEVLDYYYAEYDEEIPNESNIRIKYEGIKEIIKRLSLPYRETRLSNLADFYSLWAALLPYSEDPEKIDYSLTAKNIMHLMDEVMLAHKSDESATNKAHEYLNAARQGSNKASNREIRARILGECIITI